MSYQVEWNQDVLKSRLEELGITLYQVAKRVAIARQENAPVTKYHSTIGKAFENPHRSSIKTIAEIVEALGGKLIIEWEEVAIPTKEQETDERLTSLEGQILEIKAMLSEFILKSRQ